MKWPFSSHHKHEARDARVTALDEEARANEISLVRKIVELDRRRHDLNQLTEAALRELRDGAQRG